MKLRHSTFFLILAGFWLISGCDFQAASDAFDEFDLVIGLEPVNTVMNGLVVDNSTGELVSAQLTFGGADASAVIDAYSDPISEIDAQSGIVTFGIQNSLVPSAGNPVRISITAEAAGYYTSTHTVQVTDTGDASFTVNLTPVSAGANVPGTTLTRNSSVQTDASGAATQTTVMDTGGGGSQASASATFTLIQGTKPLTRNGTTLQGGITTDIRVFDSAFGLVALPSGALDGGSGTNQSLVGASFFKMVDNAGNVATGFQRAPGKGFGVGKGATACEDNGGTSLELRSSDASLVSAFSTLGSPSASVYAYTPADGQNTVIGSGIPLTFDGTYVRAEMCFGGTLENVSTGAIGDPSDGIIYTYALVSGSGQAGVSGTLGHQVTVSNPSASATQATFTLTGPGFQLQNTRQVSAGSTTLPLSGLLDDGSSYEVFDGASYALSVRLATGAVVSTGIAPSPLSGSSSLTLPATSGLQTYSLAASMSCPNPASEKFEVRLTSESLDALSAFYRVAGTSDSWTLIRRSDLTGKTATDASVSISGSLSLMPNTSYRFKGVLGNDDASVVATTPGAAGTFNVTLNPDDIGLSCVAR